MSFPIGEKLFHCGVLIMGIALVFLIVISLLMAIIAKKLRNALDREYGKKRH